MLRAFQSVDNEQGKTAVLFFVSMAVLAFLLHPKTSPFAEHYYNFKAETQLKQLYDSCTLVWASGGQHNISAANKGKKILRRNAIWQRRFYLPMIFCMINMLKL